MADKNLRIKVSTQGAKKAGKELGGVDNRLKDLAKSAGKAALAFFGARMLLSGMQEAIRLAGIQEQAEKKLSIALGGNTSALLKQASALQQVTTAGDEAIIEQQAFLASLKFTEEQIKEIIPVALDLSAATGISLESAVRNTAKTFSGLSGELGELIPQLRDLTAEEMKAGEAVQVMADLFGGQAAKQAETMAGAIEQAKNAAGDAAESIGDLLAPAVISISKGFKGAAEAVADYLDNLNLASKAITETTTAQEKEEILLARIARKREAIRKSNQVGARNEKEQAEQQAELLALEVQLVEAVNQRKQEEVDLAVKNVEAQADVLAANAETLQTEQTSLQLRREKIELTNEDVESFSAFLEKQQEKAASMQEENDNVQRLISGYPELAKQLGLVVSEEEKQKLIKEEKEQLVINELKQAALVQGSAMDAMKAVVRAESMEAVSGLIASILKTVPFPANLMLAAGAGAAASKLIDKGLSSFAQGGDFVTSGPQMMMVGDNPGGRERVQVTPLSSNQNGPQQGITVNITGGVVDQDYVTNELIPALNKATGTGATLNA
tara:strand:+ start:538 stop:2202 length:1665 start_codon:yes stop_codon:yes gene_type:complete